MPAGLLIVNGCSLTRGQELGDPNHEAWPSRLAVLLGADVVNLARDGGSNRRVVRTCVEEVPAAIARSGLSPSDVTVMIMWTHLARNEYHSVRERETYTEAGEDRKVDLGWHRLGPWRESEGHEPSRAFYSHLWSEHGQATGFLVDWTLLDAFLRSLGCRARYAFGFPIDASVLASMRRPSVMLDADRTLGAHPAGGVSFVELAKGHPRGPGGHPLAEAHASFAALVAGWLGP